jgi:hypothetical protein
MGFNANTANKDEWLTPPSLIKALGKFDLDPCTPIDRPWNTAENHYNIEHNGLNQPWEGRVWLNPPYGKETFKWMDKLAKHGNGIALIFARTDTKGFHESIFLKADAIFFLKGRIKFWERKEDNVFAEGGTANGASCLIVYGVRNMLSIYKSKLNGAMCPLSKQARALIKLIEIKKGDIVSL